MIRPFNFTFHIWMQFASRRGLPVDEKKVERCVKKKIKDCLAPHRGGTLPIYQNNGFRRKTNRSAATGAATAAAARLDISGRASLAISVLALNYDEVSRVGSISRATNRKKTHTTCLRSPHGSGINRAAGESIVLQGVRSNRECTSAGPPWIGIAAADVIFRGIWEYKP